jgi:molybdenum cofactor guanylyltransferase
MSGLQPQVVHVAGAGAAKVIGCIARELGCRGYRVACVRENSLPESLSGSAGADVVVADSGTTVRLPPEPRPGIFRRLRLALHDHHLILAEGFSDGARELIEVVPPGSVACHAGNRALRALIGSGAPPAGVPGYAPDDTEGLCACIEARYLKPDLSGAILAGGRSSRLGRDKTLLTVGGKPVIERMIDRLARHVPSIRIISGSSEAYAAYGLAVIADIHPGCGPLSGIHAALSTSATEYVLVLAGDTLLIQDALLERLRHGFTGYDITLYKHKNFEPLCAVYRRTCLDALEELIRHGDGRIIDLFPTLSVNVLRTGDPEVFRSINTEDDYRFVVSRLQPEP